MRATAAALYQRASNPKEGDAFGAALAKAQEKEAFEVWPENWPAFAMFARLGTRWAHGMSGPVGLRWEAIYPLMDRMSLMPEAWDELLADLEVMEAAALAAMSAAD